MQNSVLCAKPKICFFNTVKAWGGGEKWHLDTATYLQSKGYEVCVVAHLQSILYQKVSKIALPLFAFNLSKFSFLNPFAKRELVRFFEHEKFDIVIFNLSSDVKIAAPAAKIAGVPHIVYRRGSAIPIRDNRLNRMLFGTVITEIIANSEATKHTILERNSNLFPADKIKILYNGIEFSSYLKYSESKYYTRVGSELVIGNLGRLEKQKAQHYLIVLAEILKSKNLDFKILIGGSGRLESELKLYAEKKNVSDKIVFCGFIEDVPAFMQHIDIFALTSLWEGFGYVLAEASACAKPGVAFNQSSNPELIVHGETGFLVQDSDIQQFASYILKLSDTDLRQKMGLAAQKNVISKFDIQEKLIETELYLNNLYLQKHS